MLPRTNRPSPRVTSWLLAALASPLAATAQAPLLVGPSGLPQIRDAIAAAVPGDVIVVEPGTYAHFDLTVGVTIRAQVPGTVTVAYDPAFLPAGCDLLCLAGEGPSTVSLPAGQTAHVVGVGFAANQATLPQSFFTVFHRVLVTGGTVVFEDCTFGAANSAALTAQATDLVLIRCDVAANGVQSLNMPGLRAVDATVQAIDSTFTGNQLPGGSVGANPAILLSGSDLHGSGLVLTGPPSNPQSTGGPALVAASSLQNGARVWLSDSALIAGSGACAVDAPGAATEFARCTFSQSATCPTPPSVSLVGVAQPQAPQLGATLSLDYRTDPNGFVVVLAATALGSLRVPVFAEPLRLEPTAAIDLGLLLADPSGLATGAWPIPATPSLVDLPLWFQAATGLAFPLRLSPLAGGLLR